MNELNAVAESEERSEASTGANEHAIRAQTIQDAIEVGEKLKERFADNGEAIPGGWDSYNQAISDYQESLKKLL